MPIYTDVHPVSVLQNRLFWLEAILCSIHLPPFMTFEIGLLNWENFILYRAETAFAVWNTLRLYRFWACFVDYDLAQLPRKHTVSSFTGVRMDSVFTIKNVLNGTGALQFITFQWTCLVMLLGEALTCVKAQLASQCLLSALWFSSTTTCAPLLCTLLVRCRSRSITQA